MNLEIKRQFFHASFGIAAVTLLYFEILGLLFFLILFLIGIIVSIVYNRRKIKVIKWFLDKFDREGVYPGQGALTFLLAIVLSLLLFEKNVALASLMILSLGDSFSHLGKFGKIKHPFNNKKFIEGVVLGILVGWLGAFFFVSSLVAFFGSSVAMLFESFEINILSRRIDDNIIIPLVAGVVMSL